MATSETFRQCSLAAAAKRAGYVFGAVELLRNCGTFCFKGNENCTEFPSCQTLLRWIPGFSRVLQSAPPPRWSSLINTNTLSLKVLLCLSWLPFRAPLPFSVSRNSQSRALHFSGLLCSRYLERWPCKQHETQQAEGESHCRSFSIVYDI